MELFEYLMNNKDVYFSSEYFLQISTIEKEITENNLFSIEKLINEITNNENIEILNLHYEAEMLEKIKTEQHFFTFGYSQWNKDRYRLKEDCFVVFRTDKSTYNKFIKDNKNDIYILQSINNDLIKSSNKINNVLENKMIKFNAYDNEDFTYITHSHTNFDICRYLANRAINTNSPRVEVLTEIDDSILGTDILDHLRNDIRTTFDSSNDGRINFANELSTSFISIDELAFPITDTNIDSLRLHDADGDSTFIASRIGVDVSNRPSITNVVADNISTSYISQNANSITSRVDSRLDNIESILSNATDRIGNLEDWRNNHDNQRR